MKDLTIKVLAVGLAKGVIETVGFPTTAQIDEYKAWNATVHNIGEAGVFGLGVVNAVGPGNIVLKVAGEETVISPGYYLRYYYTEAKPNCTRLTQSGEVKFSAVGTYTIKIWGMHKDAETWYYDDEKVFTVTVEEELIVPTLWEKLKKFIEENPLAVAVGLGSVVGGAVIYQKKSEK